MRPDDEAYEDWEVFDVEEFSSYGPVISGLSLPLLATTLMLAWLLDRLPGAFWTGRALVLLFATSPFALFLWWVWDKKALRLQDGRILPRPAAKRYAVRLWAMAMAVLVLCMTGSHLHKPCTWYIEQFNSRCQRAAKRARLHPFPAPVRAHLP